jgi:hypothetical protein
MGLDARPAQRLVRFGAAAIDSDLLFVQLSFAAP